MKYITRTIWILSIVSFFTDVASEMLYPVMPIFLESIGFSAMLIGVLEGVAEATAGFSKGYFGKLSDLKGKRVPFVQLGYALSAISRPLMVVFTFPIWIFLVRTLDRLGKGIRTGARDAILSDESTSENKGKVFGFHRSLDTLGAVAGPGIALLFLYYYPEKYQTLFIIAFIPGLIAVLASMLIKEKIKEKKADQKKPGFFSFLKYWKESPSNYRRLLVGLLVFTLVNSSDMFLLLKAKESGLSDTYVIGVYIFYNLIYAIFSFPLGALADKIGIKTIYIGGLVIFAIVYSGMAFASGINHFLVLFIGYGIFSAATEGVSKAWISLISEPKDTATAIGTYTAFQSVCAMIASTLTGLIWMTMGSTFAFLGIAAVTLIVSIYLLTIPNPNFRA
jgi:MFS family permease